MAVTNVLSGRMMDDDDATNGILRAQCHMHGDKNRSRWSYVSCDRGVSRICHQSILIGTSCRDVAAADATTSTSPVVGVGRAGAGAGLQTHHLSSS